MIESRLISHGDLQGEEFTVANENEDVKKDCPSYNSKRHDL